MWNAKSRWLPMLTLWCTILLGLTPVLGADMYIYPTKGQTPEQQAQDKSECHTWAVQQTQFDPTQPQPTAMAPSTTALPPQGGGIRGAGRGAAMGAVGGAIAGDAGKGAAVGAATGAMMGRMRQRDQMRQQQAQHQQAQQQQQAVYAQQRSEYDRAVRACLTGRGYTIQ
jgi:Glycine zipper